jgi:hypothetical protein
LNEPQGQTVQDRHERSAEQNQRGGEAHEQQMLNHVDREQGFVEL